MHEGGRLMVCSVQEVLTRLYWFVSVKPRQRLWPWHSAMDLMKLRMFAGSHRTCFAGMQASMLALGRSTLVLLLLIFGPLELRAGRPVPRDFHGLQWRDV